MWAISNKKFLRVSCLKCGWHPLNASEFTYMHDQFLSHTTLVFLFIFYCIKINESQYITLFVVSGSIEKLFSIDYVSICLFSIFFSTDFQYKVFNRKVWDYPTSLIPWFINFKLDKRGFRFHSSRLSFTNKMFQK